MKKKLFALLALLIALCTLIQGCTFRIDLKNPFHSEEAIRKDKKKHSRSSSTNSTYTPYDEYERGEEAIAEPIPFSQMTYQRPDANELRSGFGRIQALVEDGRDAQEVLDALSLIYNDYILFQTMSSLAYIHYTLDLNDEFYDEENHWCETQSPLVEQALEKCYIAMAQSSIRDELERLEFGEGFFAYYDENQVYSNDRVVELMQEEADLQTQYMSLQSDMTILWEGEEVLVDELFGDDSLPYTDLLRAYQLYYDKYNPLASEIFAKLIRLRREIAQELDYDSYAEFAYEFTYDRDYTPKQAKAYTGEIAEELSGYYYKAIGADSDIQMDADTVMEKLRGAAYRFGGEIATAYDYMLAYDLYDLSESTSKMPGSYMTYLWAYEMPYLYVSPTGKIDDLLTATHEFGHFVDGFVNCNQTSAIDCNEIFSQALEYLMLNRAELRSVERSSLTKSKLADSLITFLSQACYAEFEQKVYELKDDELDAEHFNQIFLNCNEAFGMGSPGLDSVIAPGWIDVQHFFVAPFYVISYCISNDAALQVYQIEQKHGTGLATYHELLRHSADNTVLALLKEADMESPFAVGRVRELADFFDGELS